MYAYTWKIFKYIDITWICAGFRATLSKFKYSIEFFELMKFPSVFANIFPINYETFVFFKAMIFKNSVYGRTNFYFEFIDAELVDQYLLFQNGERFSGKIFKFFKEEIVNEKFALHQFQSQNPISKLGSTVKRLEAYNRAKFEEHNKFEISPFFLSKKFETFKVFYRHYQTN